MFTKTILFAVLAACGVHSSPEADRPPDTEQPNGHNEETVLEDHYFCCHDVNLMKLTGEGCVTIGANQVDSCANVLYCGDSFTKKDGTVACAN